jgi:predicted glycosyltransferase
VLLPRNKKQAVNLLKKWPHWFADSRTVIPENVIDGLNLLWHSDLVVSGGGTMNREAAALGVPVYSVFRGKIGAVDRQLQKEGRLTLVENSDDVERKIVLARRNRKPLAAGSPREALPTIVRHIEEILDFYSVSPPAPRGK